VPPAALHDPVLAPLVTARTPHDVAAEIDRLLIERVQPVAQAVARLYRSRGLWARAPLDTDDAVAQVLLRMTVALRDTAAGTAATPIASLDDYVAVATHNACHALLRAHAPARARLRARVRYVCTHDPALTLRDDRPRGLVTGLVERVHPEALMADRTDIDTALNRIDPRATLPAQVRAIATACGHPMHFDDLVDALARHVGVDETVVGTDHPAMTGLRDVQPPVDAAMADRAFLVFVWNEIRELPVNQRRALLLNLRDDQHRGMIGLLPLVGLASADEIADVLEWPREAFAAVWNDLPRDDEWIAAELGVTRRQVINLRKCARERLGRRVRAAAGRW